MSYQDSNYYACRKPLAQSLASFDRTEKLKLWCFFSFLIQDPKMPIQNLPQFFLCCYPFLAFQVLAFWKALRV